MAMIVVFLLVALLNFVASNAEDGQELLAAKDSRYYGFPFFWFGRPVYDGDDDNYAGNGGQGILTSRRSSTVSYVNVGAGWGR